MREGEGKEQAEKEGGYDVEDRRGGGHLLNLSRRGGGRGGQGLSKGLIFCSDGLEGEAIHPS